MNPSVKEKYPHQITKKDGRNCYLTISNEGFEIDKVRFFAAIYDLSRPAMNRIIKKAFFMLGVEEFLELCSLIESDRFEALVLDRLERDKVRDEQKEAPGFTSIRSYNGGSGGEKPECRSMDFSVTTSIKTVNTGTEVKKIYKPSFIINIARGPGKIIGNGLIARNGAPTDVIRISMTYEEFKGKLLNAREHYRAYLNAQYASGKVNYHYEAPQASYQKTASRTPAMSYMN